MKSWYWLKRKKNKKIVRTAMGVKRVRLDAMIDDAEEIVRSDEVGLNECHCSEDGNPGLV